MTIVVEAMLTTAGDRFSTKSAKLLGWDCKVAEKGIIIRKVNIKINIHAARKYEFGAHTR